MSWVWTTFRRSSDPLRCFKPKRLPAFYCLPLAITLPQPQRVALWIRPHPAREAIQQCPFPNTHFTLYNLRSAGNLSPPTLPPPQRPFLTPAHLRPCARTIQSGGMCAPPCGVTTLPGPYPASATCMKQSCSDPRGRNQRSSTIRVITS